MMRPDDVAKLRREQRELMEELDQIRERAIELLQTKIQLCTPEYLQ